MKYIRFMKRVCILYLLNMFGTTYSEVLTLEDSNNDNRVIEQNGDGLYQESDKDCDKTKNENVSPSDLQQNTTSQQDVLHKKPAYKNSDKSQINVHAILDLTLGNEIYNNDAQRIDIYVAPSCLHCGSFLVKDLQDFLDKNSRNCFIRIRLLPVSAKDLFVMKIIQSEAKDANGYYMIYLNYVRRAIATVKNIKPTEEQQKLYKGSATDPEMIKYQAVASAFGFSDEKIVSAYPDMDAYYEKAVMDWYKNIVETLKPFCPNKNLDLPLIIQNGKSYKSITDVPISN